MPLAVGDGCHLHSRFFFNESLDRICAGVAVHTFDFENGSLHLALRFCCRGSFPTLALGVTPKVKRLGPEFCDQFGATLPGGSACYRLHTDVRSMPPRLGLDFLQRRLEAPTHE